MYKWKWVGPVLGLALILLVSAQKFGDSKINGRRVPASQDLPKTDCKSPAYNLKTFEDLKNLIADPKANIKSIDDLVACLPDPFRKNYILMFKSQSIQFASYQKPRAILFGPDASLMLAFSGEPNKQNYNSLEVTQFREDKARFDFKEIKFSDQGVAKVNESPTSCVQCHRADPRPNWDAYNHWRGAYFGRDSQIPSDSEESKNYEAFLNGPKKEGRYKWLEEQSYAGSARYGYEGHTTEMPRTLDNDLTYMNMKRVSRKMTESPAFEFYKYAIFAASLSCSKPEDFIPTDLLAAQFHRGLDTYEDETKDWMDYDLEQRQSEAPNNDHGIPPVIFERGYNGHSEPIQNIHTIGFWRFLMENRGIKTNDWTMNVDPNLYSFYDGSGRSLEFVIPSLVDALNDKDIQGMMPTDNRFCGPSGITLLYVTKRNRCYEFRDTRNAICEYLKDKSQAQLKKLPKEFWLTPKLTAGQRFPAGLESCKRCHGRVSPQATVFNFEDLSLFAKTIKEGGRAHGTLKDEILYRIQSGEADRMPKNGIPLSQDQVSEIQDYLKQF
jgi:hypothetical protein